MSSGAGIVLLLAHIVIHAISWFRLCRKGPRNPGNTLVKVWIHIIFHACDHLACIKNIIAILDYVEFYLQSIRNSFHYRTVCFTLTETEEGPADSARFSRGPLPVTMACTKKPNIENMASRPFFSSFTFSSANASGSSARPSGSKLPPGYRGSLTSPSDKVTKRHGCISYHLWKR